MAGGIGQVQMFAGPAGLSNEFEIGKLAVFFVAEESSFAHEEQDIEIAERGHHVLGAVEPFL